MPRILQCLDCLTLDKVPSFGNQEQDDLVLQDIIDRLHTERTTGLTHRGNLFNVDDRTWNNLDARTQIERQMWADQAEFAATRDTYTADAGQCYNRHGRPKQGCLDWCDSSKKIGNPSTKELKRDADRKPPPPVYLCQFCPVASWVATEQRHAKGLYKEQQ